jgi:hypothetical protein
MATEPWPASSPEAFTIRHWRVPIIAEAEVGENWGKSLTAYRPAPALVAPAPALPPRGRRPIPVPDLSPDPRLAYHPRLRPVR